MFTERFMRTITLNPLGVFTKFGVTVTYADGTRAALSHSYLKHNNGVSRIVYTNDDGEAAVTVRPLDDALLLYLDFNFNRELSGENTVRITFEMPFFAHALATYHEKDTPWSTRPAFVDSPDDIPDGTETLLFRRSDTMNVFASVINGRGWVCKFGGSGINVSTGMPVSVLEKTAIMTASNSQDPFEAISLAYSQARADGAITIPLRSEKKERGNLRGLGFCSWNAFEFEPTEEKLFAKADEFMAKGLMPSFFIIDTGWQCHDRAQLEADPEKFPHGLAHCVAGLKERGIKYVGMWFSVFNVLGYLEKDTVFPDNSAEYFRKNANGDYVPVCEEETAYKLYKTFFEFLKKSGVDFVKADDESSLPSLYKGTVPAGGVAELHSALEKASEEVFGLDILNSMGQDLETVYSRPFSVVGRSSSDFMPGEGLSGFAKHAIANAYNAVSYGELTVPDYDMFWSGEDVGLASAVLRFISGGPFYLSDKLGETNPDVIKPFLEEDGTLMQCELIGKPTFDCLYNDPLRFRAPLKIWNRYKGDYFVAIFNFNDTEISARAQGCCFPDIEHYDYRVTEFFTPGWDYIADWDSGPLVLLKPGEFKLFRYTAIKDN